MKIVEFIKKYNYLLFILTAIFIIIKNLSFIQYQTFYLVYLLLLVLFLKSTFDLIFAPLYSKIKYGKFNITVFTILFQCILFTISLNVFDLSLVFEKYPNLNHFNNISKLNDSQKEIINTIQKDNNFTITSLSKNNKTIILLGESHIKNKKASILGKKFINEFDVFAVEGVTTKDFPIITKIIKPFYSFLQIFGEESTIHDVKKEKRKIYYLEKEPLLSTYDSEYKKLPFYSNIIMHKRNLRMNDNILKIIKKENIVVVIVGALHIHGLVKLLIQNGFS